MTAAPPAPYTVAEAARLLRVGRDTIYRAIERGEIPNAGISTVVRIPRWFIDNKLNPPEPACS